MSPPSAGPAPLTSCCPASSGRYHAALHRTVSRHVHGASYSVARRHCSRCEPPRPLQCSPVPRCPIPADTAIGNRRMPPAYSMSVAVTTAPHVVLPGTTPVGSGRHCGWQSSPACRPHRCGATSTLVGSGRHCGWPSSPACPTLLHRLASAHAVAGEHDAWRRPNAAASLSVGTRCGRRTRCPAGRACRRLPATRLLAAVVRRVDDAPYRVAHRPGAWRRHTLWPANTVPGVDPTLLSLWVDVTTAPRAVLPSSSLVGSGRHCGWQSSQACRPHSCGSPSPQLPVQCCPTTRWSVLADTAAGNRRRHAARIAVGRRHHSSPFSVAQHHAGRFWQTLRLALAAVMLLADTAACPRRRQATGRHCGLPSPPSGYWQTLRLALAAVMPSATVSTAPHAVCRPVPPCTTLPWAAPRRVASCCSASYGRHRAAPRRTIIQTPP